MRHSHISIQYVTPVLLAAVLSACAFAVEAGGDIPAYVKAMQPFEPAFTNVPSPEELAILQQLTPPKAVRQAHETLTQAAERLRAAIDEAQRQELKQRGVLVQEAANNGMRAPIEVRCASRLDTSLDLPEEFVSACREKADANDAYTRAKLSWASEVGTKCGMQLAADPVVVLQRCGEQAR